MKTLFFLLLLVFGFWSCNKDDSVQEITIKKSESIENKDTGYKKGPNENSLSEENKINLKKISSKEVKLHIGDSLIIKGYVADIYLSEKVAYLNFENKFPKNILAATIFDSNFKDFGDLMKYKNKNVEVIGKVTTFKNKPQIILTSIEQIRIVN